MNVNLLNSRYSEDWEWFDDWSFLDEKFLLNYYNEEIQVTKYLNYYFHDVDDEITTYTTRAEHFDLDSDFIKQVIESAKDLRKLLDRDSETLERYKYDESDLEYYNIKTIEDNCCVLDLYDLIVY